MKILSTANLQRLVSNIKEWATSAFAPITQNPGHMIQNNSGISLEQKSNLRFGPAFDVSNNTSNTNVNLKYNTIEKTLTAADWISDSTTGYYQSLTIDGIKESSTRVYISIDWKKTSQIEAVSEVWTHIVWAHVTDNTITFALSGTTTITEDVPVWIEYITTEGE